MLTSPDRYWQTPAVRHLAWLCSAPPLIRKGPVFHPGDWLPPHTRQRLTELDQYPAPLLARLEQSQSHRLGHYFEELYHFLLEYLLGWPVLLRNQPIRAADGSTLGELDFIVRNARNGRLEHHEVAVKFYLGLAQPEGSGNDTLWYGPNARDRLDLKTDRMVFHQCTMSQRPETRSLLAEHNLDEPLTPALVMPGNLFTPPGQGGSGVQPPDWVNPEHESGYWVYHSALADLDTEHWSILRKPHWLGPVQQAPAPDFGATRDALAAVAHLQRPALFAALHARADRQGYEETERWFVVPDGWPGGQA